MANSSITTMKQLNYFFGLTIVILLITNNSHAKNNYYCDDNLNYCLIVGEQFSNASWKESISFSGRKVDHKASSGLAVGDKMRNSIEIYESIETSCSEYTLGSYELNEMNIGDKTIWAKMLTPGPHGSFQDAFCTPSYDGCSKDNIWAGTCKPESATYSFCSEKGDKRVGICFFQQTDNLQLAQEIFSSFRWLEETDIFHDIPEEHEYASALKYLKENSIISGYPDGTFRSDNPINRAEFTKIVVRAVYGIGAFPDFTLDDTANCFTDVSDQWFAPYVCFAKKQGVIDGYSDETFKPEQTINFAEAAKIVSTAFGLEAAEEDSDIWYRPYVEALADKAAIPVTINLFDQPLTRGQMAEIVYRLHSGKTDLKFKTYEDIKNFRPM